MQEVESEGGSSENAGQDCKGEEAGQHWGRKKQEKFVEGAKVHRGWLEGRQEAVHSAENLCPENEAEAAEEERAADEFRSTCGLHVSESNRSRLR